jgi:phosphate starvation-inducible membrane PsiE
MIPNEIFKRRQRHNNTPQSILLIIINFIVVSLAASLFTNKTHVNWFFWIVIALLALYNFFTIRRNIHEFNKLTTIVYVASVAVLIGVFFLFKGM